jgi:hypothetical protein
MNLERYNYDIARTYRQYSFYSEGSKGRIHKVVRFYKVYTGFWENKGRKK